MPGVIEASLLLCLVGVILGDIRTGVPTAVPSMLLDFLVGGSTSSVTSLPLPFLGSRNTDTLLGEPTPLKHNKSCLLQNIRTSLGTYGYP